MLALFLTTFNDCHDITYLLHPHISTRKSPVPSCLVVVAIHRARKNGSQFSSQNHWHKFRSTCPLPTQLYRPSFTAPSATQRFFSIIQANSHLPKNRRRDPVIDEPLQLNALSPHTLPPLKRITPPIPYPVQKLLLLKEPSRPPIRFDLMFHLLV